MVASIFVGLSFLSSNFYQDKGELEQYKVLAFKIGQWSITNAYKFNAFVLNDRKELQETKNIFTLIGSIKREPGKDFKNQVSYFKDIENDDNFVNYSEILLKEIEAGDRLLIPRIFHFKLNEIGTIDEGFEVVQVINKNQILAKINDGKILSDFFVVDGINTNGLTDGMKFKIDACFQIAKTTSYTSVLGANKTVLVIETVKPELLNYTSVLVKESLKKQSTEREIALAENKKMELEKLEKDKKMKAMKEEKDQIEKVDKVNAKAKSSITKLSSGLASYIKRYDDSFKESNPKIADQMQAQAITYIQNGDKRLADAIKYVNASTLPDAEKQDLIKQATEALVQAKKKVGVK
jgi:hypothetical protein